MPVDHVGASYDSELPRRLIGVAVAMWGRRYVRGKGSELACAAEALKVAQGSRFVVAGGHVEECRLRLRGEMFLEDHVWEYV